MDNIRKEKFCKPCNSKTHSEADCWGPCSHCGRRNHQPSYCKFEEASSNQTAERASKATEKGKKKNKKTGKKATIETSDSRKESEEKSEGEASEEVSPKKARLSARSSRVGCGPISFKDLNDQLSSLKHTELRALEKTTPP